MKSRPLTRTPLDVMGSPAEDSMSKEKRAWGEGELFRPVYLDKVTKERKTSAKWWIRYRDAQGNRHLEPTGSKDKETARAMLHNRVAASRAGVAVGPVVTRTLFEEIVELIRVDYRVNKQDSDRLERSLKHLLQGFAGARVAQIDEARIDRYKDWRLGDGAANGTVNRELAALRRMLRLGERARRVGRVPHVAMLKEDNRRTGFLEPAEFRAIRAHLPPILQALADVAYITGWRVKSDILSRQWYHVDFGPQVWGCECGESQRGDSCADCGKSRPGWLRLEPGEGKSKEGRMFPLIPELRSALVAQRQRTDALERTVTYEGKGRTMPWVFWRPRKGDAEQVRSWRRAWAAACVLAGLGETIEIVRNGKKRKIPVATRIPHDFRRTAVRNLEMAGVDRSTAKALVGHKTDSVYTRYAIVDARMAQRGAEKLSRLHEEQTTTSDKVRTFKKRGGLKA